MKAFMTKGTIDFLQTFEEKYPNEHFYFMQGASGGLAYYEASDKNVFESGREFEILLQTGTLNETGYVVMRSIPVTDEQKYVFEDRFAQNKDWIQSINAFECFRLLKPVDGAQYVILTQWSSKEAYDIWQTTNQYEKMLDLQTINLPAYFAHRPYTTTYQMAEEEDEGEDE